MRNFILKFLNIKRIILGKFSHAPYCLWDLHALILFLTTFLGFWFCLIIDNPELFEILPCIGLVLALFIWLNQLDTFYYASFLSHNSFPPKLPFLQRICFNVSLFYLTHILFTYFIIYNPRKEVIWSSFQLVLSPLLYLRLPLALDLTTVFFF